MKIAVVGTGYVGLSNSILLSQFNDVTAVDVIQEKVDMVNDKISPIVDKEIEEYLKKDNLRLYATTDASSAYADADFVIVSTPTNYDEKLNYFDTSSVLSVVDQVRKENPDAYIVIKSTIPVGYTEELMEEYHTDHIMFSPEFLREGHALYDNLYPSRIIVGYNTDSEEASEKAKLFAGLLKQGALKEDVQTLS
jgi:UDPglucose 6-dehydrogenase